MPYLTASDDNSAKRLRAIRILALLPQMGVFHQVLVLAPSSEQGELLRASQGPEQPDVGKDIARTTPPANSGTTTLFDGFKNYAISGFSFSSATIVPWGTDADIMVANPGSSGAMLFIPKDEPPYTGDLPPGKTRANAGIYKMAGQDWAGVTAAPTNVHYDYHYVKPEVGVVYCLRTWDGSHFAKIMIEKVGNDQVEFKWRYQPSLGNTSFGTN